MSKSPGLSEIVTTTKREVGPTIEPAKNTREAHSFPQAKAGAHTYGHDVTVRRGHERVSGHSKAHRIGRK